MLDHKADNMAAIRRLFIVLRLPHPLDYECEFVDGWCAGYCGMEPADYSNEQYMDGWETGMGRREDNHAYDGTYTDPLDR